MSFYFFAASAQENTLQLFRDLVQKMTAEYDKGQSWSPQLYLKYCDSALTIAPSNKKMLDIGFALSIRFLNDTPLAMTYLRKEVSFHPYDDALSGRYCWFLLIQGKADSAFIYAKRAYDMNRASLPAVVNYGHALFLGGRKDLAEQIYEEALESINTMEEFDQVLGADFTLLNKVYPHSGFNSVRASQTKKMQLALEKYKLPNKIALEYLTLDSSVNTSPRQLSDKNSGRDIRGTVIDA